MLIYSILVAGRTAHFAEMKTKALFRDSDRRGIEPFLMFGLCRLNARLMEHLKKCKVGKYKLTHKAILWLITHSLNLRTVTPQQLEKCPGIGQKTSRFFIVWTRPYEQYAVLDRHILRWMKSIGHDVKETTPQSVAEYERIEKLYLAEAEKIGITPRELDSIIWEDRRQK
jgi:thermostable 8-oxoguanine DNA glycosylase